MHYKLSSFLNKVHVRCLERGEISFWSQFKGFSKQDKKAKSNLHFRIRSQSRVGRKSRNHKITDVYKVHKEIKIWKQFISLMLSFDTKDNKRRDAMPKQVQNWTELDKTIILKTKINTLI